MAVEWVKPIWEGRDGSFSGAEDEETTLAWKVKTTNKYDNPLVLLSQIVGLGTVPVPGYLDPHPNSSTFRCKNVSLSQESESPYFYKAVATYDNRPQSEDEQQNQTLDPLERTARIRWSSQLITKFTDKDKDGDAMLNSANDPLQPLEVDDVRWIITVDKNVASVPIWVSSYANTVNEDSFDIDGVSIPARCAKMQSIQISEPMESNGITYRALSLEIAFRHETWDFDRLDEGFRENVGGTKTHITDGDGNRIVEPALLDDGLEMSEAQVNATGGNFITFEVYEESDFDALTPLFT